MKPASFPRERPARFANAPPEQRAVPAYDVTLMEGVTSTSDPGDKSVILVVPDAGVGEYLLFDLTGLPFVDRPAEACWGQAVRCRLH